MSRPDSLIPVPGPIGRALERLYLVGLRLDRRRQLRRPPARLAVPVLSIGNLTVGGTGKTPVTETLARAWLRRGGNAGILSRGYGGGGGANDEARLLARRLPGVPHVQERERRIGGERLLAEHPEVDLVLLDDGFQHRRLARDVDLVLLDATAPFGGGHCLPAGRLREPWSALGRAHAVLLTRCDQVSAGLLARIERFVGETFPGLPCLRSHQVAEDFRLSGGRTGTPDVTRVGAFSAIGNPEAFHSTLRGLGFELVFTRTFRDHARYRPEDLARLREEARRTGAEALLTTEKDGVKLETLPGFADAEPPVHQLRIRAEFPVEEVLERLPREPGR